MPARSRPSLRSCASRRRRRKPWWANCTPSPKSTTAKAPLPEAGERWLRDTWSLKAGGREAEWSVDEVYLPLPKAGGDAWVRIGLEDGAAEFENTDRGWISWLNDVHKGRNTGAAWNWFIDLFAAPAWCSALPAC